MVKIGMFVLAVAGVLVMSSCTTVVMSPDAESGAVSYSGQTVTATEEATLEDVRVACLAALNDLGVAKTNEKPLSTVYSIVGRGTNDSKIEIRLRAVSDNLTSIRIQAGQRSDATTGIVILRKVRTRLGVK